MAGVFYASLPVPGFGGPPGPVLWYLCSSANVFQVCSAVSSVISVLTWSCGVAGICMQMQYLLENLYPFRCVYRVTHTVSNVGETTSVK